MAQSDQSKLHADMAAHDETWEGFKTLIKWSSIVTAIGAFIAGWLTVIWHY